MTRPEFRCWRCDRGLNIVRAPRYETMIERCTRCKANNAVRAGLAAREPLDTPGEPLDTPGQRRAQLPQKTA